MCLKETEWKQIEFLMGERHFRDHTLLQKNLKSLLQCHRDNYYEGQQGNHGHRIIKIFIALFSIKFSHKLSGFFTWLCFGSEETLFKDLKSFYA